MRLSRIVICLVLFVFGVTSEAFARIGESIEEISGRFGEPKAEVEGLGIQQWELGGFLLYQVLFTDEGASAVEVLMAKPSKGKLSQEQIDKFLEVQIEGDWQKLDPEAGSYEFGGVKVDFDGEKETIYLSPDGSVVAKYDIANWLRVDVSTQEGLDALEQRVKLQQEKESVEE